MNNRPVIRSLLLMVIILTFSCSLQPATAATDGLDGFGIGSSAHLRLGIRDLPQAYDEQQRLGLHWTREEIPWGEVEYHANVFRWVYEFGVTPRNFPAMLDLAAEHQINVMALLVYGPHYLAEPTPDELVERWRIYVQQVVNEFGEQIDYWEIGNEMNSRVFWGKVVYPESDRPAEPDPVLYARMLSVAYDIIKAADPQDTVILGGLVTDPDIDCPSNPFVYLGELYRADVWDKFDIIGFHPYWSQTYPEEIISRDTAHDPITGVCLGDIRRDKLVEEVRAMVTLASSFGAKPVWITEIGWNQPDLEIRASQRGIEPDAVEADYLVRTYVPLLSETGVENIFWYTQVRDVQGENYELGDLGLRALGNLATLLSGSQPLGQFQGQNDLGRPTDDDAYEYRFTRDGELIIVVWKARGGEESRAVTLSGVDVDHLYAYPAVATDLSLEAGELYEVTDGSISLFLNEHPILLRSGVYSLPDLPPDPIPPDDEPDLLQKFLDWWHTTGVYQTWLDFTNWLDQVNQTIKDLQELWENAQDPLWWLEQAQIKCCGGVIIPMGLIAGGFWLKRRKPGN